MRDTRFLLGPRLPLILLLPLALAACRGARGEATGMDLPPVLVRVAPVHEATRQEARSFSGYTWPWEAHGVGFLVAGRVTALHVDAGDRVEAGQLLAEIAPEDYALVKRLAEVQVSTLEPNVERVDALVKDRVLPAAQFDEIHGRYRAALTQREQAKRQLTYTRLLAPVAGVVMKRETAVGQVIGAGMPALILLDTGRAKLKVGVTQRDLAAFTEGRTVDVSVPGYPELTRGLVHHVGLVPDPKTRTWEAEIALDDPAGRLRPGLLGQVTLVTYEAKGIFVPLHAVKRDRAGAPQVYVVEGGRVAARAVALGALLGTEVQVVAGLAPGDPLIVEGQGFVFPGDEVRVETVSPPGASPEPPLGEAGAAGAAPPVGSGGARP